MTAARAAAVVALIGLLVGAAGCGGEKAGGTAPVASPLAPCDQLATAPAGSGPAAAPGSGSAAAATGEPLPELTLPCFTGGEPFPLASLRGPAVVNLWASWCAPCRAELPVLQRYADQVAGRVHVLGVVTEDRPDRAAALATDLGVRFPALADPDGRLRAELGAAGLPVTLFVDPAGHVRYVHRTGALDQRTLPGLVAEHLGVPA